MTVKRKRHPVEKFVTTYISLATNAWVVMLLVGAIHSHHPAVPTVGYWLTVVSIIVVRAAVGTGDIVVAINEAK